MPLKDVAPEHFADDAWNFPARPDPTSYHERGVVDGDTFDLWLRVSPGTIETTRIRFMHISTSEIRFVSKDSEEYRKGMEHYRFVLDWFQNAISKSKVDGASWPLFVRTDWTTGLRGRYLADIYDYDGNSLADALLETFGEDVRTPDDWHPRDDTPEIDAWRD